MSKEDIKFKPEFVKRYSKLTDFDEFKEYSLKFLRRSIRANTLKIKIDELKKRIEKEWTLTQIPWCKEGFWVEHKEGRRDIGNAVEHVLGYFYVQEAASMIPPVVLNPKPGEIILDMCASPGSKTTQIAQYMNNKGILVANDYDGKRIAVLQMNMQRCGAANSIMTAMYGQGIRSFEFDRILVDAPCSGTGTIRKSPKTPLMWNPDMVRRLSIIQKKLIETAFNNLKDGGTLVYSTCSLEAEENEEVVDYLLDKYENAKLEEIKLNIKRSPAILEFENKKYNEEIKKCLRIWPQDNDSEGFFVAKIQKV